MEAANDGQSAGTSSQLTSDQKKVKREREGLILARANVLKQLEASTNERYAESLRQALNELDKKIAELAS